MAMGRLQELTKGLKFKLKPWPGPGPTVAAHTRDLWSESDRDVPDRTLPQRHRPDGGVRNDSAVSIWDGVIADPVEPNEPGRRGSGGPQ
jgi:hypothetical protein